MKARNWEIWMKYYLLFYSLTFMVLVISLPMELRMEKCSEGHEWGAHGTIGCLVLMTTVVNILMLYVFHPSEYGVSCSSLLEGLFLTCAEAGGHLDLYTDICFFTIVKNTSSPEARLLLYLSAGLLLLTSFPHITAVLTYLYQVARSLFTSDHKIKKAQMLRLCILTEMHFNQKSILLSRRTQINNIARKMSTKLAFWKLITEDLPQCCIQLYYVTQKLCDSAQMGDWFMWISIAMSIFSCCIISFPSFIMACLQSNKQKCIKDSFKEPNVNLAKFMPLDAYISKIYLDLQQNEIVRSLTMKYCKINCTMLKGFDYLLILNKTIQECDLGHNAIGYEGAVIISRGLDANGNNLQHLDVSYNIIPDSGMKEILKSLSSKTETFKYVNLSGNIMGQEATDMLVEGIKQQFLILQMVIQNCNLHLELLVLIFEALKEVPQGFQLTKLDISGNGKEEEEVKNEINKLSTINHLEGLNLVYKCRNDPNEEDIILELE